MSSQIECNDDYNQDIEYIQALMYDSEISWRAKGLMLFLYSNFESGQVGIEDILPFSKESKNVVYSTVKELKRRGYIRHVHIRDANEHGKVVITKHSYAW